jgi:hypothetical protein
VFVGVAAVGHGNWLGTSLGGFPLDGPYPYPTLNPLQVISSNGTRAAAFASRASDNPGNIGFAAPETVVINTLMDAAPALAGAWGMYIEADITNASVFQFLNVENDIYTVIPSATALSAATPFTYNNTGHTSTYRVACGAGRSGGHNCSTGFEVIDNQNTFEVGYLCGATALDTASSRIGQCLTLADNQGITWYSSAPAIQSQMYEKNTGGFPVTYFAMPTNGSWVFAVNNIQDLIINSVTLYPATNNAFSLGASSLGWANVYSLGYTLLGTTSGLVTVQSSTGTYNFNLPTTAGSSGSVLTSGGGGSSPMTWTNGVASKTCTVNQNLTLIFTNGILTGGTCNS